MDTDPRLRQSRAALTLAALGIVYGDIGTSPLHAVKETFSPGHGIPLETETILGGISAILFAGLAGAALFYGDAMLPPAISDFGKETMRIVCFSLVFPAFGLNYLGQRALLKINPGAIENPIHLLYPRRALYPMIAPAMAGTVLASQATISGAYSLTRQAIQLGYLPRMSILHTFAREVGQICMPAVNWFLLSVALAAVIGFGSSSGLASAYGVAVTGTMLVSTFLTFFVIRKGWDYNLARASPPAGFLASGPLEIGSGRWFPLMLGA